MDSGADILHMATHREVLKLLECPVCMEVPFPPIYNCTRGHIVCHICRPKLKECVMCKESFSDGRNSVAESIVLSSMHICKFKEFGCEVQQDGHSMAEHIKICKFRNGPIAKPVQIYKPVGNQEIKQTVATTLSKSEVVLPKKLKEAVVPQKLKEAVVPQKLKEAVVPQLLKEAVVPHKLKEAVVPQKLRIIPPAITPNYEYLDWTQQKLKLFIETSNSPKVVEDCRNEIRRRLFSGLTNQTKSIQQGKYDVPARTRDTTITPSTLETCSQVPKRTEYPKKINSQTLPSAPPAPTEENQWFFQIPLTNPIGLWYAHFSGEYVVRQMEIRRGVKPVLLWTGSGMNHNMFELKLSESCLLNDKEAIISQDSFEAEWVKNGGKEWNL